MLELGNDLYLALEPQAELRVRMQQLTRQDFDGDLTLKAGIVCPINRVA